MQIFKILPSMETAEVLEGKLGDHLTPDAVLLIVDHETRKIYYYKGRKARLSLQVLGALLAQDLRRQLKLFYSVGEVLGWDPLPEYFTKLLDVIPQNGKAEEIRRPVTEIPLPPAEEKSKITPSPPAPASMWGNWKAPGGPIAPVHWNIVTKDVLKRFQSTTPPKEFVRNILQVGGELFSEDSFLEMFVQDRKQIVELEKIGGLPDGFTFIEGLPFRVYGVRGQVEAIEYLLPENRLPQVEVRVEVPVLYKDRFLHARDPALLLKACHLPEEQGASAPVTPEAGLQPTQDQPKSPSNSIPATESEDEEKKGKKRPFML